ncbi:hypothetical protein [Psychrobacillus insolitus]|nr:hypothetical protein [Psychrobacillus insolitus]
MNKKESSTDGSFSHLFEYNKFGANRFGNVHLEKEQLNFSTID